MRDGRYMLLLSGDRYYNCSEQQLHEVNTLIGTGTCLVPVCPTPTV